MSAPNGRTTKLLRSRQQQLTLKGTLMTQLDDNTLDTLNTLTDPPKAQTTLDDPTLNTLTDDDGMGTIDWDAPESRGGGGYTPQVYPGVHNFLFALEDDKPFETREYDVKDGKIGRAHV